MAGLALHYQKNETAKTTPIAPAFKNCTCRRKKWLLNRTREQVRSNFLLGCAWGGGVTTEPQKYVLFGCKTFYFV
jgi:hypothetical protein